MLQSEGETTLDTDHAHIANYVPDRLYVHPGKEGAYASIAADSLADGSEAVLAEIDVSERTRLAVSMFHVTERNDWNRLKITKLKHTKRDGWRVDGEVVVSRFDGSKLAAMLNVLSSLDLAEPTKAKIDLRDVQVHQLTSLLGTSKGRALVQRLSQSPELEHDIVAVAAKRRTLAEFERLLTEGETPEPAWQAFFEANPWVFGYGLAFVFFSPVGDKLESVTMGAAFDRSGKRADGLLRTRAAVSQCVLVEIKRSDTALLQSRPYRPGTWGLSHELSDAVTQAQKTAHDFTRERFRFTPKDEHGTDIGDPIYAVTPRTYLVVGNQAELRGNDDEVACFELYRRNVRAPEIITFDELFKRARCIVDQIDRQHTADAE